MKKFNVVKGITYEKYGEKKITMYNGERSNGKTIVYDGEYRELSKKEFQLIRKKPHDYNGEHGRILVKTMAHQINKTLEESYEETVKAAEDIKKLSKGKLNMFFTGSIFKTVLNYFYSNMNNFRESDKKDCPCTVLIPDPITKKEAKWIKDATTGSIQFGEKYKGEAYAYDIVSFYPSMQISRFLPVPYKQGEFLKLTQKEFEENTYVKVGIYRAKIIPTGNYKKQFRINNSNKYTNIDIRRARELGYDVKIIEDEKPNCLIYKKNTYKLGSKIFRKTINYLYSFKREIPDNKIAKLLVTSLWGALSQHNRMPVYVNSDDNIVNIDKSRYIEGFNIDPKTGEIMSVEVTNPDTVYETDWARFTPFLLSLGREYISKLMEPHIDHIHRCHTDGFISDKKLDIETGRELGNLKYEGYYKKCIIHHVNKIEGKLEKDRSHW